MTIPRLSMIALAAAALGVTAGTVLAAPEPPPSLPADCHDGQVVVSKGGGRFACVSPREALLPRSCSKGELVTAGSLGELECTELRVRACSRGDFLTTDAFGRLECARPGSRH